MPYSFMGLLYKGKMWQQLTMFLSQCDGADAKAVLLKIWINYPKLGKMFSLWIMLPKLITYQNTTQWHLHWLKVFYPHWVERISGLEQWRKMFGKPFAEELYSRWRKVKENIILKPATYPEQQQNVFSG